MNGFLIGLIIFIIILIIAVVLVAIFTRDNGTASPSGGGFGTVCSNQNQCGSGLVCVPTGLASPVGLCEVGLANRCSSTAQCGFDMICSSGFCTLGLTELENSLSKSVKPSPPAVKATKSTKTRQQKSKPDSNPPLMPTIPAPSIVSVPTISMTTANPITGIHMNPVVAMLEGVTKHSDYQTTNLRGGPATITKRAQLPPDSDLNSPPSIPMISTMETPAPIALPSASRTINRTTDLTSEIDACSHSIYALYLLANGQIRVANNEGERVVKSNVNLVRIVSFNGYLHGLDRTGIIYTLQSSQLTLNQWNWQQTTKLPRAAVDINASLDAEYLVVHTKTMRYTYHKDQQVEAAATPVPVSRTLGQNNKVFVDINEHGITPSGSRVFDNQAKFGIYDHRGQLFTLPHDSEYGSIRIVNWRAYYIK